MIIVLMGVTGAGKTTVGRMLADSLGWKFVEGDDFHPVQNKIKMGSGVPLSDLDRGPWLAAIGQEIWRLTRSGTSAVLTCSALKERYRRRLHESAAHPGDLVFVYLRISPEIARHRLEVRADHFMPAALVPSQFADLEEPARAVAVDATKVPEDVIQDIRKALGLY